MPLRGNDSQLPTGTPKGGAPFFLRRQAQMGLEDAFFAEIRRDIR